MLEASILESDQVLSGRRRRNCTTLRHEKNLRAPGTLPMSRRGALRGAQVARVTAGVAEGRLTLSSSLLFKTQKTIHKQKKSVGYFVCTFFKLKQ